MNVKNLQRGVMLMLCLAIFTSWAFAQTKTITGKITDSKDGSGISGASVLATGGTAKAGTQTANDGSFKLVCPESTTKLVITSLGYQKIEVSLNGQSSINVSLVATSDNLNEVVVIGYGTAKKKELTGAYATVSAKNFNQIPSATPDQLLQGKVAGLQVTVASGQPGAATSVKIRGNNSIRAGTNPLYVVDGVPLDGRSARPGFNTSGLGNLPDANPLTYLNPADIENISVLKDASASAIYGSRGANGVILITTRSGSSGPLKVDVNSSWSIGGLMKQPDVLDAGQYRTALTKYGAKSDSGASYKPFNQIIQHNVTQNYSIALSGGSSENSRYRASFLASSTPGLIRKSGLDKYIANFNGSYKLLDKKLSINFGVTAASVSETIAPVSNDPGSTGSIVSNALQWNPTLLMKSGSRYIVNPNGQVNPLAFSDAYNDKSNITTLLGNFSAGYKIIPELEYKFSYGVNYSSGIRKNELQGWISGTGGNADGQGLATVGSAQLFSQTITQTLTYTKKINEISLTALGGYENWSTKYQTQNTSVYGFDYNLNYNSLVGIHYYDNMQDGKKANLSSTSSNDPNVDVQSYFARIQIGYKDKYSLSASFRADGSSKFGSNNKYAYFPAISARWSIKDEDFMKNVAAVSTLNLRAGWGQTGNQEFPAGAAVDRYQYQSNGALNAINFANPNLKWETVTSSNFGLDYGFLGNRINGSFEVFFKKTTNPLFPGTLPAPAPAGTLWQNLPGYITNRGFEFSINGTIVEKKAFSWTAGINLTYVKNKFIYDAVGNSPLVLTGQLNGKGTSATYVQAIANNQPIDVFYLRKFSGFDQNGFAITTSGATYAGDPNPHYIVGFTSTVDYKKFSLFLNMHGAFDYSIYNNTLQSVTGLSFINNGGNISKTLIGTPESVANPVSASTRYMYSGNFMKLSNVTLRYRIGNVGKVIKNLSASLTAANLFVITKYPGFDPEVNVSKLDQNSTGIPSIGIDYVGYPTLRSFTFGLNFSLY
ncbi:MAG: SusC/RagA family TonB-linked outer membrane protein [Sphingobacteriia bacterium]|nr:SusC/RagA family TonB-linked outer membrane protein [Sphingobacteriia bacterium]